MQPPVVCSYEGLQKQSKNCRMFQLDKVWAESGMSHSWALHLGDFEAKHAVDRSVVPRTCLPKCGLEAAMFECGNEPQKTDTSWAQAYTWPRAHQQGLTAVAVSLRPQNGFAKSDIWWQVASRF